MPPIYPIRSSRQVVSRIASSSLLSDIASTQRRSYVNFLQKRPSRLAISSSQSQQFFFRRNESTASSPPQRPLTDRSDEAEKPLTPREDQPSYQMTFTCRKCLHRSSHKISKQAYHHGTTLITCPDCKNRHLISDHLKIFSDKAITLEDILKEKGQMLKKGALDAEGNIEFWDDSKAKKER